ncbi:MAG: diguanylate cyclase [Actinomycetota bacterium]|nr:diguanylate cyclase [Actinomycetota bacterium]
MRILVADDDLGSRLVAQAAVEALGHQCVTAADGDSAWRMFGEYAPEVLITDRQMPGLDGLQLCRTIRAAEKDSYTYIILVTSSGANADVLAGMRAGADDYLTKPVDPFDLQVRLLAAERVTVLHDELARYRKELNALARTDPLTQLRNRRTLDDDLALLHSRSQRYARAYSLAIADIDNFKGYNDTYGHQAGDEALRLVAAVLSGGARSDDSVYRYGGEEFLVMLPEQSSVDALVAINRLRTQVEALRIGHTGSRTGILTISAGVASFVAGRDVSAEELLGEADVALYSAKAAGRNTVVSAVEPPRAVVPAGRS